MTKLKDALLSQPDINDLDQLKISYALELLRNESIKTVLYCAFFLAIGYLPALLLCMAISCTVRVFSGGIHMKTNVGCFVMGFIMLCGEILLLPSLPLPQLAYVALLWISVAVICLLSPIASYKRPFKTQKRYALCKKWAILFSIAWGLALTFCIQPSHPQHCGIWYLVIQAIQLVCQSIYRYYKNTNPIGGQNHV